MARKKPKLSQPPQRAPERIRSTADLRAFQRLMMQAVTRPLAPGAKSQRRWADGRRAEEVVGSFAKANDRLSALERIEIYNRMYWFRTLDSLQEDLPGLRAVLGEVAEFTCLAAVPAGITLKQIEKDLHHIPDLENARITVVSFDMRAVHDKSGHITHRIEVDGPDRPGVLARLSEMFGQFGANIVRLNSERVPAKGHDRYLTRFAVNIPPRRAAACLAAVANTAGELRMTFRFEEADDCFKEAVSLVRGSGHEVEGSVLCWRSGVQLWRGHWDAAIDTADQAQRVAERVKSLYLYSMSRSLGGYAKWMGRQDPDALQAILEATTWLERDGKSLFISLNYGWLSEILVARGQFHAARQYAARALKRARSHDRIGGAMACRAMARAAAAGQHHKSPGHYLVFAAQNAMTRNSMHETALNSLCQAELFLAIDHRAAANEHLQMALQIFDRLDMTWHAERTRSLLAS